MEITSFQRNDGINITLYVSTEKCYWSFAVIMITSYWFDVSSKPSFVNSKNTAQNFPLCAVCSDEEWRFDMFNTETEIFRVKQVNATTKTPYWDLSSFMFSSFNSAFIDESRIL